MSDEQGRIYPLTAEQRESKAISNGAFRLGFDTVSLDPSESAYWQVKMPANKPAALLSRVLETFEGGGIVYRVFTNATGTPSTSAIQRPDPFGEVTFLRVTGVSETGVTIPPASAAALLQEPNPSDLDFVPTSGTGNNATGGAAGGQAFRPQPPDVTFYLHAYNGAAQARTLTVRLTWCVGDLAKAEVNKSVWS